MAPKRYFLNKALAILLATLPLHMPINTNAIDKSNITNSSVEEHRKRGDVNEDGSVDSVDASLILSIYAETSTGQSPIIPPGAYVSPRDDVVDSTDASIVLAMYADISTGGYPTYVDESGFFVILSEDQTIWDISQKEGYTLNKLISMNPHIENPDNVAIGTKVYVYLKEPTTTSPTSTTSTTTTSTKTTPATSTTTTVSTTTSSTTKVPSILDSDLFVTGGIYKLNSTSWKLYTDETLEVVKFYINSDEQILILGECTLVSDEYLYGYECMYNGEKAIIPLKTKERHSNFEFVAFNSALTNPNTTKPSTTTSKSTTTTSKSTSTSNTTTAQKLIWGGNYSLKEGLSWKLFTDTTFSEVKHYLTDKENIVIMSYCYNPDKTYNTYLCGYKTELLVLRVKPENTKDFQLLDRNNVYFLLNSTYILNTNYFPLFDETGELVKIIELGESIKILEYQSSSLPEADSYICEYKGNRYIIHVSKNNYGCFELLKLHR